MREMNKDRREMSLVLFYISRSKVMALEGSWRPQSGTDFARLIGVGLAACRTRTASNTRPHRPQ